MTPAAVVADPAGVVAVDPEAEAESVAVLLALVVVALLGPVKKNVPPMGFPKLTEPAKLVILKWVLGVDALTKVLAVESNVEG